MQMPSLTVGKRANTSSTGRWIQSAFSRPVNVGSDSSLSILPLQKLSSLLSLLCPELPEARAEPLQVTVLIPGPLSVDDWLDKLGTLSHAWPQPHQLRSLQVTRVSAQAFEAARVSAAVKHLWPGLRPQWTTIYSTLRLEWPGVYDPSVLHGKFFDNVGQSDHTQDSQYQGKHWWWVFQRFRANQGVMARRLTISEPWGFGSWQANMVEFEDTLRLERAELDSCEETRKANHQYRTSHGTYRIKRTQ